MKYGLTKLIHKIIETNQFQSQFGFMDILVIWEMYIYSTAEKDSMAFFIFFV